MLAIYRKELNIFLNSLEGWFAMMFFLSVSGLTIFFIPSSLNLFQNNQADLSTFFLITPWIFLILIPSITMKLINGETNLKTISILLTKPITSWDIIIGKYLASKTIGILSTLPTLFYAYTIYQISEPQGNIDLGKHISSYIGVVLIISSYSAIGIFCSSISKNTMISFLITIITILLLFFGLEMIGHIYDLYILEYLSMHYHYKSISRGIIDSRDIIYFISITLVFLFLSKEMIRK